MKKNKFVTLLLLLSSLQLSVGQTKLPVIRANSKTVDVRVGNDLRKAEWMISPETKPDIYTASAKKITFYTDLDSISFNIKAKLDTYNFIILLNGKDSAYTQVKFPKAIMDNEFDAGSGIALISLNKKNIAGLEELGLIWGFLKYHHPEIAKGNYNWDYELFRILPKYLKAANNEQRDKILIEWINKYGEIPVCNTCKNAPDDAFLKPDFSWLENSNISQTLKSKILNTYKNRNQGNNFYISLAGAGNPEFVYESDYSTMSYPDAGYRLLSLYRFWNMIHYFYPNRNLTDKDWNKVLAEYIPVFIGANNKLEYELAALRVIGEVNDTHTYLRGGGIKIAELRGDRYAPFRVHFIENKLVVVDYFSPELAGTAGLKIGDIITHINGKSVESIVDSVKPYYPASNQAARLRDIAENALRSNQDSILITYVSSGQLKQKALKLYKKSSLNWYDWYEINKDEKCYKLLDGNIGYITLVSIKNEDIQHIKESFKNTKGIIIDIRNYPSTFVPFSLGSYFVSDTVSFVKITIANIDNPGEFNFIEGGKIPKATETYQGKLVVLVNELTQSQAEFTSMAFRAGRNTTIVGSTTAGADGNLSWVILPGGLRTGISGIGVFYPNGTPTQRVGIIPDIKIEPTINGIKNGKDELLEKAIEIIKNETTNR